MKVVGKPRLDGIESLRSYAAIAIILFHLVGSGGATLSNSLSFIGSHFGFGVPLFFVLSGFSMAYGYFGKLDSELAIRHYFLRRFTRIAPFFYVMIVFQLLVLYFVSGITYSPLDVLLHAIFAFNVVPHLTEGIVPASWTIGVEMIFYALFPLLLLICTSAFRSFFVVLIATAVATKFNMDMKAFESQLPSFVYHNFVVNFPYFLWGVLSFHVQQLIVSKIGQGAHRYLCWALLFGSFWGLHYLYGNTALFMFFTLSGLRTAWDTLWSIPFSVICLAMALHPSRIISNSVTQYLGKISFSLYLVHPTVLYALGTQGFYVWVYSFFPHSLTAGYAASAAISLAIITAISSVTYRFIEVPGMNWGKRMTTAKLSESVA
jgi:peptidoglycan/LPS O-acetylase OafA/YrhL